MPRVHNFGAPAPGKEQNQDAMFQCEAEGDSTNHFTVTDAAGNLHTYERPDCACRFRIASDGSLREVVDLDGNPVEIRSVK